MYININRLKQNIEDLGKIGYIEGRGISREAFTEAYYHGENFVLELMKEAGLLVRKDALGNIYGRLEGQYGNPTILVGSHIDTVPNGGKYDGAYGVLAAIECLRVIKEQGLEPLHAIEVVAFNAEEGNFLGGTFGSSALIGEICFDRFKKRLIKAGIDLEEAKKTKLEKENIKCYLELHIEQGEILDELAISIGIVTGIVNTYRYKAIIKGCANHAGTTSMKHRDDALVKASRLIEKIHQLSLEKGEGFVGTAGKLEVIPNVINVIPGEVHLYIEFRSLDKNSLEQAEAEIRGFAKILGRTRVEVLMKKKGIELNKAMQKHIEESCKKLDLSYKYMPSGAGHDAANLGKVVPAGMIFIPSVKGISHCKDEFSRWDDVEKGANVLLHTILSLI